jgi:hypothetical protein
MPAVRARNGGVNCAAFAKRSFGVVELGHYVRSATVERHAPRRGVAGRLRRPPVLIEGGRGNELSWSGRPGSVLVVGIRVWVGHVTSYELIAKTLGLRFGR